MRASSLAVPDFGNFFNAISPNPSPPPIPSHVSFDVRWAGGEERRRVRDETFGFTGKYVAGEATIDFTATGDGSGVVYRSDATGQYNPTPAQGGAGSPAVGHERNGSFFH